MYAAFVLAFLGCDGGVPTGPPETPGAEPAPPDLSSAFTDQDGDGYVALQDCNDLDRRSYPGAPERCNGLDDDCDGAAPDETDGDGDGWRPCNDDCDDADPAINASAEEVWYDGVDQDCDGRDDDRDQDGSGVADDCDDLDSARSPGSPELCDGVDNDCDGTVPADEHDDDGDGERTCEGDCDDASLWAGTFGRELCNGADDDCDGVIDADCVACDALVPGDYATLQSAIDGAASGDLICAAGNRTYTENLDFGGAAVTLWGVHGAARTIVDGGGTAVRLPVVQLTSGEGPDTVLRGFTLTNGSTEEYGGAGIRVVGASPTLMELVVAENGTELEYGDIGGVGVWIEGGEPTILDCVVRGNDARGRWGVERWGGGLHLVDADVLFENLLIEGNEGEDIGCGIAMEGSTAALFQVSVLGNGDSCNYGGGVYMSDSTATLTNVLLSENAAYSYSMGGALAMWSSSARLTNVGIVDNWAGGDSGWGGGISAFESTLELTNVVIRGNWATGRDYRPDGGGLYASDTSLTFTNVTLTENGTEYGRYKSIPGAGGAMYLRDSSVVMTYSNAWNNEPDNIYGIDDPTGIDGNLAVDPTFEDDALHLSATSPLVDAGDPAILDPDGSRSDIGAYGGAEAARWDLDGDGWAAWWLPGPYDPATSPDMDCDDADPAVHPGSGC